MKKRALLFIIIILSAGFPSGCSDKNSIVVSEPNSSTIWTSSQGLHDIKWKGSEASEHIFLYKGQNKLAELNYYVSDDGDVVVKHPNVKNGSDYRIKLEDEKSNYGFSENFTIKQ